MIVVWHTRLSVETEQTHLKYILEPELTNILYEESLHGCHLGGKMVICY